MDAGHVAHSADIPRAQSGTNSQRLLAAMFADFTFESAGRFPSAAITKALGDFGISEAGARSALSRVTRRGLLVPSREGRMTFYTVSEQNLTIRLDRLRRYLRFGEQRSAWDGRWTVAVFSVSEPQRSVRPKLRAALEKLGMAPMADAVWVTPHDKRAECLALRDEFAVPLAVMYAEFEPGGDDLAPEHAFDLAPIGDGYREFIETWRPLLLRSREGSVEPSEAFVARVRMLDEWRRLVLTDPDLPVELLPTDWPRADARQVFVELWRDFGPLALVRLRQIVREFDPEAASRLKHHDL
ncbi:MAG: PaaX family transcriptional regulator [Chloroflexota bacterium]|nr:PaaX family transcriptional regulator [Chloroflexota bacterium]